MDEKGASKNHIQSFDVSIDLHQQGGSKCFDDDGRLKRTGTMWTASAHITAVIGSGVLSLAWAIAQLGWIAGPRNYTYMDAVHSNLGGFKVKLCGLVQYLNLVGVAIGYTIASSISMMAIERSNCFHKSGGKDPCHMNSNIYMISFGVVEIIFSQIPDFHQLWWLSILAAVMSFTYSTIGLGLGIGKVIVMKQDTVKSPPRESKTMKKATFISVVVTTFFYMLCGCFGYAAFGDSSPGNLLTGFGFYNPYWLLDIANAAIVIHLIGAYQVYCQPLFAFVENYAAERFPDSEFVNKTIQVPIPGLSNYKLNLFRSVWRTIFVILTTLVSMLLPFFNDIVGLLGALGFWPLTVYFPVEMYIIHKKIPKWSPKWMCLHLLSIACLIVTVASAAGSVAGIILDLQVYKPFKTIY
ncbi:Amino acid transporter, transmembrane domain [Sesbania bispinosa]|nr:Amino acid transporter, transmembrane domain [Sesbania bispinosa]